MEKAQADIRDIELEEVEKPSSPLRRNYLPAMIAFISAALVTFLCLWIYLARSASISNIKAEILRLQTSLNETGWDIAYDDLSFSPLYPKNVLKVKNFILYAPEKNFRLTFPSIEIKADLFNPERLNFVYSSEAELSFGDKNYKLHLPQLTTEMMYDEYGLRQLTITAAEINIPQLADISKLQFAVMQMAPANIKTLSPLLESHLQIENIKFNKSLNLPWSDKIEKIYLNGNIIGKAKLNKSYKESIYEWLSIGGYVDIKKLVLNSKPLALVGRGNLNFNEKLAPNLHLETSSKALLDVLEQMERHKWLENKGVFVSKILLSNKAFKMSKSDEHLTVTTPIDYKDGKLLVENITVAKIKPDTPKK